MVPANLASGESTLHGLHMATVSLCAHMAFLARECGVGDGIEGRGRKHSSDVSSYKDTNAIRAETLMTSFNLKFLRDPISKYNHTGVRVSTRKGWGWGGKHSVHTSNWDLGLEFEFRLEKRMSTYQ